MGNPRGEDGVGSRCEIKRLYNHSLQDSGRSSKWSEFADPIKEEQRLKALGQSFAIVHRSREKTTLGEKMLGELIRLRSKASN